MHRIFCFGSVSSSATATYSVLFTCKFNESNVLSPYTLNLTYVQGARGPRLETMKKDGKTITGWPGGPVHDVDHLYMDGICMPETQSGFESLFTFSSALVVPAGECEFGTSDIPGDLPSLTRGQSKAKLMKVSLKKNVTPWLLPYAIEAKILIVGRTLAPFPDQKFTYEVTLYLRCTCDGNGDYRVIDASTMHMAIDGYKFYILPPITPVSLVQVRRGTSVRTGTTYGTATPTFPYLNEILSYWEKEKKALMESEINPDKVRDCTLDAMADLQLTQALSFENLKDLIEFGNTVKSAINLYGDVRKAIKSFDPLRILKVIASVHLIHRYVIKTSWKDLRDLIHLSKVLWAHRDAWWDYLAISRGRGKRSYSEQARDGRFMDCTMNVRLDLRPAQYQTFTYMRTVGLAPSLVGFWDLVPWSFVVDWVLPVGETIDATGALIDLQFMRSLFVTTLKSRHPVSLVIAPGTLCWGHSQRFHRIVSDTYQGTPHSEGFRIKNPLKNFWTGAALIITTIIRR